MSYFAMRSVNRIIKITFLINFDWMNSLSECLVTSAAIITTVLSALGRKDKLYSLTCNLLTGACGAEYFYREKYQLWHIGRSDQSAYLYNLTGAEKLELERTTTRTTGWSALQSKITTNYDFLENLLKVHVLILLSLQSFYIILQWKKNSSLHLHYKSLIGDYIL